MKPCCEGAPKAHGRSLDADDTRGVFFTPISHRPSVLGHLGLRIPFHDGMSIDSPTLGSKFPPRGTVEEQKTNTVPILI